MRMIFKDSKSASGKDTHADAVLAVENKRQARREARKDVLEAVGAMAAVAW